MKINTDNLNSAIERKMVLKQSLALHGFGEFFDAINYCW